MSTALSYLETIKSEISNKKKKISNKLLNNPWVKKVKKIRNILSKIIILKNRASKIDAC